MARNQGPGRQGPGRKGTGNQRDAAEAERSEGSADEVRIEYSAQLNRGEEVEQGEGRALSGTIHVHGDANDLLRGRIGIRAREPENPEAERLWMAIRQHTESIGFNSFRDFVSRALSDPDQLSERERPRVERLAKGRAFDVNRYRLAECDQLGPDGWGSFVPGTDLYAVLKTAAEVFLILQCGMCAERLEGEAPEPGAARSSLTDGIFSGGRDRGGDPDRLARDLTRFLGENRYSYVRSIIRNVFGDEGYGDQPFAPASVAFGPCLMELIWSYWMEEGMLVQTINAVSLRFQNVRTGRGRDPLGDLEIDPLRPLSGFLWGYIQDEPQRLSMARRSAEYLHAYGLGLYGRAVPPVRAADVRTRFLTAFHDLLSLTARFYQEAADNLLTPDPFGLLVALRELHLIMAEGAHNQFRDLPWTARVEMLVQQWILARPEMREFLRGRAMVPYPEQWMGTVDSMKKVQGWGDTGVIHFRDLATYGERLLLSVRFIAWNDISDPQAAADWALTWRPEVQGYIHAYRMVTGVGLSDDAVEVRQLGDIRYQQPSVHLRNRLAAEQRQRRQLQSAERRQLPAAPPEPGSPDVVITRTRA